MKIFSGFAAGKVRSIAIPETFFDNLLPLIDDLVELKVTLACFRVLSKKSGKLRWLTQTDLASDRDLLRGLGDANGRESEMERGLQRAVARGTLLVAHEGGSQEPLYFANTERGRSAVAALERGATLSTIELSTQRANIFQLYEQYVGALTPIVSDELREAQQEFPAAWIEDAFREAARQNARSWAYIKKILESRARRGKRDSGDRRDVGREWQEFIQRDQEQQDDDTEL